MRCVHEAQLHKNNCFITLTYDDAHLPRWGTLQKSDLQKFFKRVRKQLGPFRYYACGEYGEKTKRAHYHACIFGLDFNDKIHFRKIGEHHLYLSKKLTELWGNGATSIGNLTFETAAYTARYVMKKQFGKGVNRFVHLDEETGEITALQQPYAAMSLRPAIAKQWLRQYHGDVYGHDKDYLYMRGKKLRPPKYYDKLYDEIDPRHLQFLKIERETNHQKVSSLELHAREKITRARIIAKQQI